MEGGSRAAPRISVRRGIDRTAGAAIHDVRPVFGLVRRSDERAPYFAANPIGTDAAGARLGGLAPNCMASAVRGVGEGARAAGRRSGSRGRAEPGAAEGGSPPHP